MSDDNQPEKKWSQPFSDDTPVAAAHKPAAQRPRPSSPTTPRTFAAVAAERKAAEQQRLFESRQNALGEAASRQLRLTRNPAHAAKSLPQPQGRNRGPVAPTALPQFDQGTAKEAPSFSGTRNITNPTSNAIGVAQAGIGNTKDPNARTDATFGRIDMYGTAQAAWRTGGQSKVIDEWRNEVAERHDAEDENDKDGSEEDGNDA